MSILSPREVDQYRKRGYVVPSFRLPPERVSQLRAVLDRTIAKNPDTRPERLVSVHLRGKNSEGIHGDQAFMDLAQDAELVEAISELIGPDVILWGCQIFCKPAGNGMEVPWHQDGHYWPIRPLATCTAWVALDDSMRDNGCLRVIPGSHQSRQLLQHQHDDRTDVTLNQRVIDDEVRDGEAEDVELLAGEVSFHDVYLVHGSNANHSGRRRAGIAIRYMPGSSLFDRTVFETNAQFGYTIDFSNRPLWLLRGQDQTGRNDFRTGHMLS